MALHPKTSASIVLLGLSMGMYGCPGPAKYACDTMRYGVKHALGHNSAPPVYEGSPSSIEDVVEIGGKRIETNPSVSRGNPAHVPVQGLACLLGLAAAIALMYRATNGTFFRPPAPARAAGAPPPVPPPAPGPAPPP